MDFNCEAALEPLFPRVARCIPVVPSRYIGKCVACVLKRSDLTLFIPGFLAGVVLGEGVFSTSTLKLLCP